MFFYDKNNGHLNLCWNMEKFYFILYALKLHIKDSNAKSIAILIHGTRSSTFH